MHLKENVDSTKREFHLTSDCDSKVGGSIEECVCTSRVLCWGKFIQLHCSKRLKEGKLKSCVRIFCVVVRRETMVGFWDRIQSIKWFSLKQSNLKSWNHLWYPFRACIRISTSPGRKRRQTNKVRYCAAFFCKLHKCASSFGATRIPREHRNPTETSFIEFLRDSSHDLAIREKIYWVLPDPLPSG